MFLKSFLILQKFTENRSKSLKNATKQRNMFLRFHRIALDVSYGFGRSRSMFLIVVFLINKSVYIVAYCETIVCNILQAIFRQYATIYCLQYISLV